MRVQEKENPVSPNRAGSEVLRGIFWAVFLVASLIAFVPVLPQMPGEGLDPSWMVAMNEAVAKGMVFGRDVVFTFGPYASIYTKIYHPATDTLMVGGAVFLGALFFLAAFFAFRNASLWFPASIVIALPLMIYARDTLFFFHALLVGVAVFRATSLAPGSRQSLQDQYLVLALLFAPLGLYPLIKGSTLASCCAIVALCALAFAKDRNWKAAAVVCLVPLASLLTFWMAAGQPLRAVLRYFTSMAPIISGYTEAMAVQGSDAEIGAYLVAAIALVIAVFRGSRGVWKDKALMTLAFMAVLFLAFKAGFVRHDAHAVIAGAMLVLAAILAAGTARRTGSVVVGALAVLAGMFIILQHLGLTPRHYMYIALNHTSDAFSGLKQRMSGGDEIDTAYQAALGTLKDRGGLPAVTGSTDIFSYDQSYVIASGMDWRPRPVPQSYSVYTPKLLLKNRWHMEGASAPENVFFRIQPIDQRFPPLEDGATWPILLSQYRLAGFDNGYLRLERKEGAARITAPLKPLVRQTYGFDETIQVPDTQELILARIDVRPTLAGKLQGTLFKPRPVRLHLRMANGSERSYRFIPGMGKTEFLLSPVVERTEELGFLYSDMSVLSSQKVQSISVSHRGSSMYWQDEVHVEFDAFTYEADPSSLQRMGDLGLTAPVDGSQFSDTLPAPHCDGNIESINGVVPAPQSFSTGLIMETHGWLVKSAADGAPATNVYVVLTHENGSHVVLPAEQLDRPDVGEHFKNEELTRSGFRVRANLLRVKGTYTMGLAYGEGDTLYVCPQFRATAHLR